MLSLLGTRSAHRGVAPAKVLGISSVAATLTGTTTETVLATIPIPAGAMGPNGSLRIRSNWSLTNGASSKTLRIRLGGLSGTAFLSTAYTTVGTAQLETAITNRNSEAVQFAATFGTRATDSVITGSAFITGTIDTSQAQSLVITGQLASGADMITLEHFVVESMRQI